MYEWIQSTFNVGGGVTQAIAVILALAVVLLLFGLFIFILKRLTGAQATQNRNRQPRIAVMDSATIDTRRRLLLIRRDNIEHLILVGGPSDVVVEQNIVRNTPLTQGRPGQHAAPGTAAVRGPMAPGPDIPARPDDLAAHDQEPSPSLATQARAPAAAAVSAPEPATQKPVAPSAAQLPAGARRDPAPLAKPLGGGEAPASKTEAGSGLNRAADLLRAATQNGFSRGPSRDKPAAPLPAAAAAAPAVRPASKPDDAASKTGESKTGAALKSLTRPFTPRERPSYGNHSITPPASGPAARAKTALLKPVEPEQPQKKIEPALAAAAAGAATASDASPSEPAPDKQTLQAEKAPAATEPKQARALPDQSAESPAAENSGPALEPVAEKPHADAAPEDPQLQPDTPSEQAPDKAPGPDINLDPDDLIERTPAAPSAASPAAQVSAETPEEASTEKVTEGSETAETASHGKDGEKSGANPLASAPRPSPGLGDKNPIEDEMAKILDELGGQSN